MPFERLCSPILRAKFLKIRVMLGGGACKKRDGDSSEVSGASDDVAHPRVRAPGTAAGTQPLSRRRTLPSTLFSVVLGK